MIWLDPLALVGIGAVAAPVLLHILVQRRAERIAFPTLMFLRPTRLASMRRHALDDLPLLVVRASIIALAAAAAAGPLLVTPGRRERWSQRLVQARVENTADLRDGIRRAVTRLDAAPPARREIVVSSAFPIESFDRGDVEAIPADIGIRFIRTAAVVGARSGLLDRLVTTRGLLSRDITLEGVVTSVGERLESNSPAPSLPIELVSRAADRGATDAALAAVVATRARLPPAGHRARIAIAGAPIDAAVDAAVSKPWMADAIAALMRDRVLGAQAAQSSAPVLETTFAGPPWLPVAFDAGDRPIVAAASAGATLLVASAAPATDLLTPVVIRSVAGALAPLPDVTGMEVVSISDHLLRSWARAPQAPPPSRLEHVDEDDRRWWWLGVLALLSIETVMRRRRVTAHHRTTAEHTRVA